MKITEILQQKNVALSFEVFPPKQAVQFEAVRSAVKEIASLKPDFMSVTYGAGGGTSDYTAAIATQIKSEFHVTPLAHLSCISSTKEDVRQKLAVLKKDGIENILALRGDLPEHFQGNLEYRYASELVRDIKAAGDFCIGGACYPEGHPESQSLEEDILNLKRKVDAGCDFLTTQMFFDNNAYYSFVERAQKAGIFVPVIAGIMPVTNAKQIKRILSLSGGTLPKKFLRILEKFGETPAVMAQAGMVYACDQIIDLYANGVKAVHVYSMNKPEIAAEIKRNLSTIV